MEFKAIVVIPVHSENPSADELFSFMQCYKILSNYDIVVLHPEGLDLTIYLNAVPSLTSLPIEPIWQSSLSNYNRLKRSTYFYNLFSAYDYLLTYELDSFIFRDELQHWCSSEFDYIGAPWFKGYSKPDIPAEFVPGGNSGFSLRNVEKCLYILKRIHYLEKLNKVYKKLKLSSFCSFPTFLQVTQLKKILKIKNTYYLGQILTHNFINEDKYWSEWIPSIFADFKVAPSQISLKFSFEVNPEILFEMNNKVLPFGCHAWLKYNKSFWLNYIPFFEHK